MSIYVEGECRKVDVPENLASKVSRALAGVSECKNDLNNINEVIGGEVNDYAENVEQNEVDV